MQANWREISAVFDESKNFALATIIATRGATYQKTGAMMLIDNQGLCTGLLSGGCLEADISLHAQQVLTSKKSKVISYDLSADADLLWGLGLGCDGAIDILVQPLLVENQHLGFTTLLLAIKQRKKGYYLQGINIQHINGCKTEGSRHDFISPQGAFFACDKFLTTKQSPFTSSYDTGIKYQEQYQEKGQEKKQEKGKMKYLVTPIIPPLSLLICGAGPDVVPVVMMAEQMGWQVTLWDHRQAHLSQPSFNQCLQRCVRAKNTKKIDYNDFDAVMVMTHNLTMDGDYLMKLLTTSIRYIGLLGPFSRRDKLLAQANIKLAQVTGRVYGPAGLNLGGRGPQAIALSMVSEIHQHFNKQYSDEVFKSYVMTASTIDFKQEQLAND